MRDLLNHVQWCLFNSTPDSTNCSSDSPQTWLYPPLSSRRPMSPLSVVSTAASSKCRVSGLSRLSKTKVKTGVKKSATKPLPGQPSITDMISKYWWLHGLGYWVNSLFQGCLAGMMSSQHYFFLVSVNSFVKPSRLGTWKILCIMQNKGTSKWSQKYFIRLISICWTRPILKHNILHLVRGFLIIQSQSRLFYAG